MDPEILFPEIHLFGSLPQIHQATEPPSKSYRRRLRQRLKKKISVGVGGGISAPPAMEVEVSILNHQEKLIDSRMKMKEAPPSPPSRVFVPSSDEGDVPKEGAVSMASPPSAPPTLPDFTQLLAMGFENSTILSDVSLSASKAGVDFLTMKKKRKGSDSSFLVVGRYDLWSRALR